MGTRDEGVRPRSEEAGRHHLSRRRGRLPDLEEGRGLLRRQDHPHCNVGQLLVGGRHRTMRAVLRDLPRSGRQGRWWTAGQRGARRRPLPRILEPRLHAVRAARAGRPRTAAEAVDRHRHGPRAHHGDPAGRAVRLRDRPAQGADRGVGRGDGRQGDRRAQGIASRHRRPSARNELPHRRRRTAVERGPRLRAPPHHAPRDAPRPPARRARAADVPPRPRARAPDGRHLHRAGPRAVADHRDAAP